MASIPLLRTSGGTIESASRRSTKSPSTWSMALFSAPHLKCSLLGRLDTTVLIPKSLRSLTFSSTIFTVWSLESSAITTCSISLG